ncbi:MAG: cyclic lactone autoinducer peptide [Bacilli bacterium]|nr:cyclic lactone autoinducer peptide [Bacilli bacterium]
MHLFSSILAGFAGLFANATVTGSWIFWWDEPKCPKSLIK